MKVREGRYYFIFAEELHYNSLLLFSKHGPKITLILFSYWEKKACDKRLPCFPDKPFLMTKPELWAGGTEAFKGLDSALRPLEGGGVMHLVATYFTGTYCWR